VVAAASGAVGAVPDLLVVAGLQGAVDGPQRVAAVGGPQRVAAAGGSGLVAVGGPQRVAAVTMADIEVATMAVTEVVGAAGVIPLERWPPEPSPALRLGPRPTALSAVTTHIHRVIITRGS
jgi:hypothetical protein